MPPPLIVNINRAFDMIIAEMRADGLGEEVIAECNKPIYRALEKLATS